MSTGEDAQRHTNHSGSASENHSETPLCPVRMSIIKTNRVITFGVHVENWEPLCCCGNVKWCNPYRKWYGSSSEKLNIQLPHKSTKLLLGVYPKEGIAGTSIDVYAPMLIAAVLTTAKMWKWPKCSSVGERVNETCHIHTMRAIQPKRERGFWNMPQHGWTLMTLC